MIEVGDYIRTNEGIIGKIKRIEFDNIDKSLKWYVFDRKRPNINIIDEVYINKPYITKHSKNLLDLIEVGDFVNRERVLDITGEYIHTNETDHNKFYLSTHIKTILTHEQYKANIYEVEE